MVAADIENAVAAQEIEIGGVIHVVEIGALGSRIDFVEPDHALCRDERAIEMPLMQFVIFPEPRRDDFFQVKTHGAMFLDLGWKRKWSRWIGRSAGDAKKMRLRRLNNIEQGTARSTNYGFQSRYASCAPICRSVLPGECRSSWVASHWNHSKLFCEPLRRRSSST